MTKTSCLRWAGSGVAFALVYGFISPNNGFSLEDPFFMVLPILVAALGAVVAGWVVDRRQKAKAPPRR